MLQGVDLTLVANVLVKEQFWNSARWPLVQCGLAVVITPVAAIVLPKLLSENKNSVVRFADGMDQVKKSSVGQAVADHQNEEPENFGKKVAAALLGIEEEGRAAMSVIGTFLWKSIIKEYVKNCAELAVKVAALTALEVLLRKLASGGKGGVISSAASGILNMGSIFSGVGTLAERGQYGGKYPTLVALLTFHQASSKYWPKRIFFFVPIAFFNISRLDDTINFLEDVPAVASRMSAAQLASWQLVAHGSRIAARWGARVWRSVSSSEEDEVQKTVEAASKLLGIELPKAVQDLRKASTAVSCVIDVLSLTVDVSVTLAAARLGEWKESSSAIRFAWFITVGWLDTKKVREQRTLAYILSTSVTSSN